MYTLTSRKPLFIFRTYNTIEYIHVFLIYIYIIFFPIQFYGFIIIIILFISNYSLRVLISPGKGFLRDFPDTNVRDNCQSYAFAAQNLKSTPFLPTFYWRQIK